jgi:hypothetical protein
MQIKKHDRSRFQLIEQSWHVERHATKPWNNIVASHQVLGLGKIRRHFSGAVVAGQHRPRRSAEVLLPIAAVAVGRSTCLGTVLELNSISLVSCMS